MNFPSLTYDAATDRPVEECGVFAVRGVDDAAVLVALGLHALQHRGQEACGITSYDGLGFHSERRLGLVGEHFTDPETLQGLKGTMAIGHNRYSTSGSGALRNASSRSMPT